MREAVSSLRALLLASLLVLSFVPSFAASDDAPVPPLASIVIGDWGSGVRWTSTFPALGWTCKQESAQPVAVRCLPPPPAPGVRWDCPAFVVSAQTALGGVVSATGSCGTARLFTGPVSGPVGSQFVVDDGGPVREDGVMCSASDDNTPPFSVRCEEPGMRGVLEGDDL